MEQHILQTKNKKNTYPMSKTEADLGLQQHPRWNALWSPSFHVGILPLIYKKRIISCEETNIINTNSKGGFHIK